MIVIILIVLVAIFAPFLAPYNYATQNLRNIFAQPSREHWLGTDNLGRDMLSRIIYGSRMSLGIGFSTVLIGVILGGTLGTFAGFYSGKTDTILMRFLDVYQSIPGMILAIALAASLGPGVENAVIALGIGTMPVYARIIRASLLKVRRMEYIEAARAVNASDFRIIMKHALANAFSPLLVQITMSIGITILSASMLSFIGLGAQPPAAEWGAMVTDAREYIRSNGRLIMYPGIAITITVLAFNLFGDGLRDALDPRQKK
jgi:peptide/nickel transport system permease protein